MSAIVVDLVDLEACLETGKEPVPAMLVSLYGYGLTSGIRK